MTSWEFSLDDLVSVSDFRTSATRPTTEIPLNLRKVHPRSKASLYDPVEDFRDEKVKFGRGAGRGKRLLSNPAHPGDSSTFLRKQDQTSRDIREVCGFGFSNEVIEFRLGSDINYENRNLFHSNPSTPTNSPSKKRLDLADIELKSAENPNIKLESPVSSTCSTPTNGVSNSALQKRASPLNANGKLPSLFDIIKGSCKNGASNSNSSSNSNRQNTFQQQLAQPTYRFQLPMTHNQSSIISPPSLTSYHLRENDTYDSTKRKKEKLDLSSVDQFPPLPSAQM